MTFPLIVMISVLMGAVVALICHKLNPPYTVVSSHPDEGYEVRKTGSRIHSVVLNKKKFEEHHRALKESITMVLEVDRMCYEKMKEVSRG